MAPSRYLQEVSERSIPVLWLYVCMNEDIISPTLWSPFLTVRRGLQPWEGPSHGLIHAGMPTRKDNILCLSQRAFDGAIPRLSSPPTTTPNLSVHQDSHRRSSKDVTVFRPKPNQHIRTVHTIDSLRPTSRITKQTFL